MGLVNLVGYQWSPGGVVLSLPIFRDSHALCPVSVLDRTPKGCCRPVSGAWRTSAMLSSGPARLRQCSDIVFILAVFLRISRYRNATVELAVYRYRGLPLEHRYLVSARKAAQHRIQLLDPASETAPRSPARSQRQPGRVCRRRAGRTSPTATPRQCELITRTTMSRP